MTKELLKDFQRATVDHVYDTMYANGKAGRHRILIADEVGLGKTIVAKGLIRRALADYKDRNQQFKVVYICSNQQIARQNLKKLNVTGCENAYSSIDRITLLSTEQQPNTGDLHLIALSPNTSFSLRSNGGIARERALLFHILKQHPDFRRRTRSLKQLFQLDVGYDKWEEWIEYDYYTDDAITNDFLQSLDAEKMLLNDIQDHLDQRLYHDISKNRYLVGKIREALAKVSLRSLKPDLIILDEFQRFKNLLEQDNDDPVIQIAKDLFQHDNSNILLLSATPYKMYTIREEEVDSGDHYGEFLFLLKFLFDEKAEHEGFRKDWEQYSNHLIRFTKGERSQLIVEKQRVEKKLQKFICRTERNSVSCDHNTMVREGGESNLELIPEDLQCYVSSERIAAYFREKGKHNNSLIEYCKSAPFPLSFMDGYKLGRLLDEAQPVRDAALKKLLASKENWVPFELIRDYQKIEFPNARMRYLLKDSLEKGGANLLWIPPSHPCYGLNGAFSGKHGFSKTLVFSQWQMVPRAIATLVSYEAERLTIGSLDKKQSEKEVRYDDPTTQASGRLIFRQDLLSHSVLNLLYPCIYLASVGVTGYDSKQDLLRFLAEEISSRMKYLSLEDYVTKESNRSDTRWYWIVPILLDRLYFGKEAAKAYGEINFEEVVEGDKNPFDYLSKIKEAHVGNDVELQDFLLELELGRIPEDIVNVLTEQAAGSPAVCALRTFINFKQDKLLTTFVSAAFNIANAFRKYFNTPENTAVIDLNTSSREYWRKVLEYCGDGCLQSVLDEYFHIVEEANGLWEAEAEPKIEEFKNSIKEVLSLRAASLGIRTQGGKEKLRTQYAAAFMDVKESEQNVQRKEHVQHAFNSPFRPFILATTSIGQEGLDFHFYARNIMHWNLPSNPVDFEQREGRVNRYKSHAIRLNLSDKYGHQIADTDQKDFWKALFDRASKEEKFNRSDLVPFWHTDINHSETESYPIVRQVPLLPYSKDAIKLKNILRTLPLYRIALGQPNQEELVRYLLDHLSEEEVNAFREEILIDLSPFNKNGKREGIKPWAIQSG